MKNQEPKKYRIISHYFGFKNYVDATIYNLNTIEDATIFTDGVDDEKYNEVINSIALSDFEPYKKEYLEDLDKINTDNKNHIDKNYIKTDYKGVDLFIHKNNLQGDVVFETANAKQSIDEDSLPDLSYLKDIFYLNGWVFFREKDNDNFHLLVYSVTSSKESIEEIEQIIKAETD